METKQCPECRSDIPVDANRCAHCRYRFSYSGESVMTFLGWVAVVALVAMVAGYFLVWAP